MLTNPQKNIEPGLAMEKRIIFLGGSPRSGTTLVQNMLDSHPDILGGPEFLHIPDIIQLRNKLQGSVSRGWIDLICSTEKVDEEIRALLTNILIPFADRHNSKLISEKTPENVLVFSKLVEIFPDSKFLLVVRDPRAIVASMLQVGQKARSKGEKPAPFTANTRSAISYVKKCFDEGFKASHANPEKIHTIVYEKLVLNPEQEAQKICKFLGVDWTTDMLKPGEKKHLGEAAITANSKEIWYDAKTYNSNPNTSSLEKWKSQLSANQQYAINRAFSHSNDLAKLGYEFSLSNKSAFANLYAPLSYNFTTLIFKVINKIRKILKSI